MKSKVGTMPLTALQAILSTMMAINDKPRYRIISETSSDEACPLVIGDRSELPFKESFDGEKWTKYQCDDKHLWGKGTKIVYEIIDADEPEDELVYEAFSRNSADDEGK